MPTETAPMKIPLRLAILLALLAAAWLAGPAVTAAQDGTAVSEQAGQDAQGYELPLSGKARVTLASGDVTANLHGVASRLAPGDDLAAPVHVSVGLDGRLELLMPEGSVLRFAKGTEFTIVRAAADLRNRNVQVDVELGDAWATVSDFFGEGTFTLDSPTAVAGVSGTRYRVSVDPARGTSYLVYQGRVRVASRPRVPQSAPGMSGQAAAPREVPGPSRVPGPHRISREQWNVLVAQGYRFAISATGRRRPPEPFDRERDAADPWVRWNLARDADLGR